MYVTAFYSYKGGVGRTMALVNVAYMLAKLGKRVLVVDFDLEAPGLPSFEQFRTAEGKPGIVDYVCAYRDTDIAPDAADYIVECAVDGETTIWLMPAGRHTQTGYGEKLNSIDWQDLYDHHAGFLMFEDLRYQWSQHSAKFDYVLVDSRTGHTDVGGICTRQLPDAVVVMFLPNEQNIEGLKPIVEGIREASAGVRGKIELHFCPSNVPDLDDEDEILGRQLRHAAEELEYERSASMLEHYNSLDLLTQPLFAQSRPNSKLTRQYAKLMNAVIEQNYNDLLGAELNLSRMPNRYERARSNGDQAELQKIEEVATKIASRHPENGHIGWLLSILYNRMGALEEESEALTLAIEQHHKERNRAILRRAKVLASLDKRSAAADDIKSLLNSGTANVFDIFSSIDLLRALDPDHWITPIQNAIDQLQDGLSAAPGLLQSLMSDRARLPLAVRVAKKVLESGAAASHDRNVVRNHLLLSLIGLGQFKEALDELKRTEGEPSVMTRTVALFNYAMAEWGITGEPPHDIFEMVLSMMEKRPVQATANLYQCRALAEIVLSRFKEAAESLEKARSRARTGVLIFSCWRYLEVTGAEMLADLTAMSEAMSEPNFAPPFFDEVRRLVE
jgi:Mrp family chromosome partitioning ATPase/tetratricopeptide (TPR) repeat protein